MEKNTVQKANKLIEEIDKLNNDLICFEFRMEKVLTQEQWERQGCGRRCILDFFNFKMFIGNEKTKELESNQEVAVMTLINNNGIDKVNATIYPDKELLNLIQNYYKEKIAKKKKELELL